MVRLAMRARYYSFKPTPRRMSARVQQPRIPIYFGGASDAAIDVAGKHADVYALWGETHAQVKEIIARVRAAALRHRGPEAAADDRVQPVVPADPGRDGRCGLG